MPGRSRSGALFILAETHNAVITGCCDYRMLRLRDAAITSRLRYRGRTAWQERTMHTGGPGIEKEDDRDGRSTGVEEFEVHD